MKKLLILSVILLSFPALSHAKPKDKATPTPEVSPTPSESLTPALSESNGPALSLSNGPALSLSNGPSPRWIPPPSTESYFDPQSNRLVEKMAVKISIDSSYINGNSGENYATFIDADFKRKFDQYPVGAQAILRFGKSFNNSYSAETLQARIAKLSLSEPFLTFTAGRFDVGADLSPTQFFGNYLTMGIRRLDGFALTVPIRFKFGLQTLKEVETPPTAISFYYFPSLLSGETAVYDTTQSLFLEQIRFTSAMEGIPFTLRLNAAESSSLYFENSVLNQGLSYSAGVQFNPFSIIDVYGEYGVQNASLPNETSGLTLGIRGREIYTFGPLSFDAADIEAQVPLSNATNNPFTGGNAFNPSLAQVPQMELFGHVRARLEALFINFYVTNSVGNFTFARINPANSALPQGMILGGTFETPDTGLPFQSNSYFSMAYLVDLGVEF